MLNFVLALEIDATKPIESVSDKLLFGGQMLLTGMLAVFLVLGIIWLALTVFKTFFAKEHSTANEAPVTANPVVTESPVATSSECEIVAAIACALALAQSENKDAKFRVVSFKKR